MSQPTGLAPVLVAVQVKRAIGYHTSSGKSALRSRDVGLRVSEVEILWTPLKVGGNANIHPPELQQQQLSFLPLFAQDEAAPFLPAWQLLLLSPSLPCTFPFEPPSRSPTCSPIRRSDQK